MKTGSKAPDLSIALIHWPCLNQHGETIATNVTNFDIHDIARSCRTYGVGRYFIINRVREQLMFVHRVLDHWRVGEGSDHNPQRQTAVEMIRTAETVEDSMKEFVVKPVVIATCAQNRPDFPRIGFSELRERMWREPEQPVYLLFGTGWGMTDAVLEQCDFILDPIKGSSPDDYRHLSVRAAAAICLDRLMGQ